MNDDNMVRARLLPDGRVMQVLDDGSLRAFVNTTDWERINTMSEEEIEANALADPDNPPLTDEELDRIFPNSEVRDLRATLNLSQEEFSRRFAIPVGTIRDWEQGKKRPDSAARALLKVIRYSPDTVTAALCKK